MIGGLITMKKDPSKLTWYSLQTKRWNKAMPLQRDRIPVVEMSERQAEIYFKGLGI